MPEWKGEIRRRLANLKLEPARESAIVDELAAHLEDCYSGWLASGASPAEAERRTLAELSDSEILTRELRKVEQQIAREPIILGTTRRANLFADLVQDLRYGVRMLLKHRVFTAVAVLSLALGIGANTAIFSLIDALLLKSLPVKEPQQLVLFSVVRQGGNDYTFNYRAIERFNQANNSFEGIIASYGGDKLRLSVVEPGSGGDNEMVQAEQVSGNYFSLLGVQAVEGRMLTKDDDGASGAEPVAVISYDFWQQRFGSHPGIVGRKVTLNDSPFTVIGVAPKGFSGLEVGARTDLWWTVRMTPLVYPRRKLPPWVLVMGRLRAGVTVEHARAEIAALQQSELAPTSIEGSSAARLNNHLEDRIELEPGSAGWTVLRKQFRQPLLILMAAVGLVLLIACANVANLLLARSAARQSEIAVRLALGAGRFRLIRQLLTESMLLAVAGGLLALIFSHEGKRVLLTYLPQQRPVVFDLGPDARVLAFTFAVALLTGVLFGLAPALRATRLDLTASLKKKANAGSSRVSQLTLNNILIVAQVALSLFLLVGTGLFVRSLQKLKSLDAGFSRENVVVFEVDPGSGFSLAQQVGLYKELLTRFEALPGALAVSASAYPPLNSGMTSPRNVVRIPGYNPPDDAETSCQRLWVGPKFFETMGIPILQGRTFGPEDEQVVASPTSQPTKANKAQGLASDQPLAAVINQAMALHFFGDENPLGRRFDFLAGSAEGISFQVVGVVKDTKYKTLREPTKRAFYVSYFQDPGLGPLTFLLRTTGKPAGPGSAIERAVRELEPRLQVIGLKTLVDVVDESLVQERFIAQLSTFFSLFALLLASIGLYGIMSASVTRRTNEIGIRMALGAQVGDVVRLVMKETLLLVAIGLTIGLGAALATTRLISALLYGLTPNDPLTIIAASMLVVSVAALAGYLPARRASRVDPLTALRSE